MNYQVDENQTPGEGLKGRKGKRARTDAGHNAAAPIVSESKQARAVLSFWNRSHRDASVPGSIDRANSEDHIVLRDRHSRRECLAIYIRLRLKTPLPIRGLCFPPDDLISRPHRGATPCRPTQRRVVQSDISLCVPVKHTRAHTLIDRIYVTALQIIAV